MHNILTHLTIINDNYNKSMYDLIDNYNLENSNKIEKLEQIQNEKIIELKNIQDSYNTILENKNTTIHNYEDEIIELKTNVDELREEIKNFNNVSLLKKLHIKLDKLTEENTLLKRKNNNNKNNKNKNNKNKNATYDIENSFENNPDKYLLIEVSTESTNNNNTDGIPANANILDSKTCKEKNLTSSSNNECKEKNKNESANDSKNTKTDQLIDKVTKSENSEDQKEEDEDEEDVILKKINKRYYYITETVPIKVYKTIKISKGNYDIGKFTGLLIDNKIVKNKNT